MKKLLLATLTTLSIITAPASAGERTAQGDDIYNPNNYRTEYDAKSQLTLLLPDYFIPVYKDSLKDEIEYLHMIYCRKFFQDKEEYYKSVKDKLIKLIDKYNELYK